MNILFVSDLGSLGGGETSLYNLINEFVCNKNLYNVVPFLICKVDGKLVSKCNDIDVNCKIIDFKKAFKKLNIYKMFKTIRMIKEYLYHNDIKIVQCNEWTTSILFSIISKITGNKCKVIWICHGQWYKFNFIKRTLVNLFIDQIISVSQSVKDNLIKNNINENKVLKQNLGINLEKYKNGNGEKIKQELNLKKNDKILGVIARFQPIKGQKLVVETAKLILGQGYDNYKFLLVGDSIFNSEKDNIYKNEVIEMIKQYGLEENVILLGERNDIPDILNSLDALVVPSINESFGMVVIEAFAAGCPVISTPCDGPMEIIEDNMLPGIILETRSAEHLKDAILNFKNYNIDIKLLNEKMECYSIGEVCRNYKMFYERILR